MHLQHLVRAQARQKFSLGKLLRTVSAFAVLAIPVAFSASAQAQQGCGIEYVNDTTGIIYYTTNASASWSYTCLNGCYSSTKVNGRVQRQFSGLTLGTSYNPSFQIQDNVAGQILPNCTVTFTKSGTPVASSSAPASSTPKSSMTPSSIPLSSIAPSSAPSNTSSTSPVTSGVFGIQANGVVYHLDGGQSAGFVYLCVNGNCQTATKVNGRYERAFGAVNAATTYALEFKIQDNATGQCIATASLQPGNNTLSACYKGVVPTSSSVPLSSTPKSSTPLSSTPKSSTSSVIAPNTVNVITRDGKKFVVATGGANAGFSLYTFDNDKSGPSVCYDACAVDWPAYTIANLSDLKAPSGVVLGTSIRNDGLIQVTLNNRPLYFFDEDLIAGDAKGNGLGNVWWLADTDISPAGFARCATENQTCSFTGTANVVFGSGSTWSAAKQATGSIACNNATFGDPTPGVVKSCYYKTVQGSSSNPTSSVVPTPSSIPKSSVAPNSSSQSSTGNCGTSSVGAASSVDVKAAYGEGYEFGMTTGGLVYHNEHPGAARGFAIVGLAASGQNVAGNIVTHVPVDGATYYRYEVQAPVTQGTTYAIQIRMQGNEFNGGQCIFDLNVKPGEGIVDSPCYSASSGGGGGTVEPPPPAPKADVGILILSGGASARLVGGDGSSKPNFALYNFAMDTSTTSNCTGNCAVNWPPVIIADPAKLVSAGGVTGTFGTVKRITQVTTACGLTTTVTQYQVTYNGKPLYFFAGDSVAADTKGAGIANWSLATADLIPQLPVVKYPAPSLLTPVNGLIPKNFGFAIDIEGRKLTWRPSATNNNQNGLITQFSPWGGEGQPVSAKDPQLELYCSNNQIQFHKASMPGTVAGPYTTQLPAECYGKFYYFLRYKIYGTVSAEPEDNWVYTALFNYDETKPNDRFDPRLRPTVTYHSANWMRMGHPHSRDRVEEAILFDAVPYNGSLTSGLERYATDFVDGDNTFQIQPHTNGSILRIEAFEWGAGNCQGAQYMINANNPMGVGRFDYGQIISWEATFGSAQNNFPGGTAISSQVYNTMQNTTVGQGFSTATGDPRLNSSGRGGVRMVYNSGCNPVEKEERDARFAQQLTTVQDASMVNDFILGHNQFHGLPSYSGARVGDTGFANSKAIVDVNGVTQKMAGKGSCGDCHFRDGRSSFVIQTAKGPRIAPPTYGVGLLQWIEGASVGLTWDGSVPTVKAQAEAALLADLNLTPSQIGQTNFDRVVTYTQTLHVPVRDYITYSDPAVATGEVAFHNAGCAGCHQVTQKTRSDAPVELRDIAIRPYTDMKLWDIGTGGKFRTAPLWGIGQNIGLLARNNKATLFLHDGSASSLDQAITKHGNGSVTNLSATDKAKIVTFLKTL